MENVIIIVRKEALRKSSESSSHIPICPNFLYCFMMPFSPGTLGTEKVVSYETESRA